PNVPTPPPRWPRRQPDSSSRPYSTKVTPVPVLSGPSSIWTTDRSSEQRIANGEPRVRQHPHLLEISAWPWLTRLSEVYQRTVTRGEVPAEEWDRIAARGFDLVYLMGVWRRSDVGRQMARTDLGLLAEYDHTLPGWTMADVVGSPYCIKAYEPDD